MSGIRQQRGELFGVESMKEHKNDQRTRLTRNLLEGALVALMGEKPLKDISVRELCQRAGVNRSTFYLHYYDIYDLMEDMERQIGEEVFHTLGKGPFGSDQSTFSSFYTTLFGLLGRNAELCAILLGENGDKDFVARLFAQVREKCVGEWSRLYPAATRAQVETCFTFTSAGSVGILRTWLDSGCRVEAAEVARQVERLVNAILRTLE